MGPYPVIRLEKDGQQLLSKSYSEQDPDYIRRFMRHLANAFDGPISPIGDGNAWDECFTDDGSMIHFRYRAHDATPHFIIAQRDS